MILEFPNLDTLQLAITSEVLPSEVTLAPAKAAIDPAGAYFVEVRSRLAKTVQSDLAKLGVNAHRSPPLELKYEICCWLQLIPTIRAEGEYTEKTPVLFDVAAGGQFSELVGEMLRLGNDRQSFRWLEGQKETRGLLKVIGPPYYSLLRALERENEAAAPTAFLERAPRVWVEFGHSHPFIDRFVPPAGKLLFIRPYRRWAFVDEGKFRDVYEMLEFSLPNTPTAWQPADEVQRLQVPLRLSAGAATETAELWVLEGQGIEQLDAWVRDTNEDLLKRLSFAVAQTESGDRVVLRVRPSKQSPPVLVLKGTGYRSYLKIPNLFLPLGSRLHPPLRRDAVVKLLARDPQLVTWLEPQEDRGFIPKTLPDTAFRSLNDWVDYVLDREHEGLQAWMAAMQFDFEPFVCSEDGSSKQKKKAQQPTDKPRSAREVNLAAEQVAEMFQSESDQPQKSSAKASQKPAAEMAPKQKPQILQQQLNELEKQFLALETPPEDPQRRPLWERMARINYQLQHSTDATVCWLNAFWEERRPDAGLLWQWFQTECKGQAPEGFSVDQLEDLLLEQQPTPGQVRSLAAYLAWAAAVADPPPELLPRLSQIQNFLQQHENFLPIRGVWIAWHAVVALSQGDVLALARARDRLLERLHRDGLSADQDLPSFLRVSGLRTSDRFRVVRDQVKELRQLAKDWIRAQPTSPQSPCPYTADYADVIFAYGLAKLGEGQQAKELFDQAKANLLKDRRVNPWLVSAYEHRLRQAIESKPNRGQLPQELLKQAEQLDRMDHYVVDRLRGRSKILEPDETVDAYRHWTNRNDRLEQELSQLYDVNDREELRGRVMRLLSSSQASQRSMTEQGRVLTTTLELAPRLGEEFARDQLVRVLPLVDQLDSGPRQAPPPPHQQLTPLKHQVILLEKAIVTAAHFDQAPEVEKLLARFHTVLDDPELNDVLEAIEQFVQQSFRGLRRLGMREQIGRLFEHMAQVLRTSQSIGRKKHSKKNRIDAEQAKTELRTKQLLLHVAGGYFYFGQDQQALDVVEETRKVLYEGDLDKAYQTDLACTYAATLGQAPVDKALSCLVELFQKLERIHDAFTSGKWFMLSQLRVIEAVVLAMVSDDFTLDKTGRRWLDDDEYLVRRRIHQDVRTAMQTQA